MVDIRIERIGINPPLTSPVGNGSGPELEAFLNRVEFTSEGERAYLAAHLQRLVRSLSLLPKNGGRALELGSYAYTAAAIQRVLGFESVRGAYYSAVQGLDRKTVCIRGEADFICEIDLFDAERHNYPYPDSSFEVVLCCELIEHLILDPMHLLFECYRILKPGGLLLLTTPNVSSLTSVAFALEGRRNPQIFSGYPAPGNTDVPHVREYTAREIESAVAASGFEVEALFTERISGFDECNWVKELLEREGFDSSLRGEQTYCLARKGAASPKERHPKWLYAG